MNRPRIGITSSLNEGEQRLDLRYVRAIEQAGGWPVIVPMVEDETLAAEIASGLDALVVTGGPAITDGLIGALPEDIAETDPVRLASDRAILKAFLDARRPALGICYGMQLGNALLGGTLYADVERQREGTSVHSQKRGGTTHPVRLTPGSHLHALFGGEHVEVNTRHIQALDTLGEGLAVSARAPDGVIEGIETEDGRFVGVQFHPERMEDALPFFRRFVARVREQTASA